jgi:hypothetical protein
MAMSFPGGILNHEGAKARRRKKNNLEPCEPLPPATGISCFPAFRIDYFAASFGLRVFVPLW